LNLSALSAMPDFLVLSPEAIAAFLQVIMIDLVLAGDNAVVIGLAAAGLPPERRARAILVGIIAATALRILFASVAVELLDVVGLLLAGGILLLWVCWKMWRELRAGPHANVALGVADARNKTFALAAWQIVVADISMSLDNVLAVAGAARDHPAALIFGLGLSIVMMGVAASFIARLLQKHRWLAYVGLAIILYVAGDMIVRGALEVKPHVVSALEAIFG
jgi:YjbE family integral membrane protein